MNSNNDKRADPSPRRIEALSDGIFAIAMTLLVLNLSVPHITAQKSLHELPAMLNSQINDLFTYFLSFFLLAVFWILHHRQFHYIERTDSTHLWLNILILMFVALMPFSTSLIGFYPTLQYTNLFFSGNMFIIGTLFYFSWFYATQGRKLVSKSMHASYIKASRARYLVMPTISVLSMLFTFISPDWSTTLYIAVPFVMPLIK